ncbi:hypothetical protein ACJX0J_038077, partial [Zea mays]
VYGKIIIIMKNGGGGEDPDSPSSLGAFSSSWSGFLVVVLLDLSPQRYKRDMCIIYRTNLLSNRKLDQ